MLRRWVSTVFSDRNSSPAIWRFVWRSVTSSAISRSRSVSCSRPAPAGALAGARAARHAVPEPAQLLRGLLAPAPRAGGVERGLGRGQLARRRLGLAQRGERAAGQQPRVRGVAARADRARRPRRPRGRASSAPRGVAGREPRGRVGALRLRGGHAEAERGGERQPARGPLGRLVGRAAAQRDVDELLPRRPCAPSARRAAPPARRSRRAARPGRARARRRRSVRARASSAGSAGESSVGLSSRARSIASSARICAALWSPVEQRGPSRAPRAPTTTYCGLPEPRATSIASSVSSAASCVRPSASSPRARPSSIGTIRSPRPVAREIAIPRRRCARPASKRSR